MAISKISSSSIDPNVSLGDGFFKIDSTNNRVGIGTSSPASSLSFPIGTTPVISQVAAGGTAHSADNVGSLGLAISDGGNYSGVFVHNTHDGTFSSQDIRFLTATGGSSVATERMRIDNAGRVTMPYQPYIYGSPTNTGGSGTANSFYTISARGGMAFSTDRITVPVTGVYHISFNTICASSTGRVDAAININGGAIVSMLSEDNGTGYHYRSGSITVLLAANDYIQFVNNDWYSSTATGFTTWRTASVALLG